MTLPNMVDRVITPFSQFIEFANGRSLHLSKLNAHFPPNDRTVNDRILPAFVEVAFSGWQPADRDEDGHNLPVLALSVMKDRESQLLKRWMDLHDRAREAFGLIFSISSGPTLYLETRFLLAIQGLEVMHRRILPGRALEPDELEQRIQAAQSSTEDPKVREWFNSKLQFAGEKTLRKRLREILQMIGEPGHFIANEFVQKAVITRNFYTHYDPTSGQSEQGQALHYLTLQVLAVFDLFLFNQLGFENAEAAAVFSESPKAKELAFSEICRCEGMTGKARWHKSSSGLQPAARTATTYASVSGAG